MSVNGVTGVTSQEAYNTNNSTTKKTTTADNSATTTTADNTGVVYEKSGTTAKTYTPNTDMVAKMKADAEARTAQLQSLVEQMISKQGNAYGKANDIWSFLSSGDFTVDPATKAQAQADTATDGYWGVNQTSDRILDFATALSGGDPDTMEQMRDAFKKGFEEATKTWGKDLPGISSDTYAAVMKKFDDYANQNSSSTSSATTTGSTDTTGADTVTTN